MNPDPNPFRAPGPLPRSVGKAPHHTPGTPPVSNPFAAPTTSRTSPDSSIDWRTVIDGLPFGLIVLGPHMELLHENDAAHEWLGTSVKEEGGIVAWLSSLCPDPGHREKVLASWQNHIWRNQVTRTYSLKGRNQKVREIEFRSTLHQDGGLTVVLQDVTDIFRAQEFQRQTKLKFRALFDHIPQGVILIDRQGTLLEFNPAFLKTVDRDARELRLSPFEDLLHPASLADWRAARLKPDESKSVELRLRTPAGSRPLEARQFPVDPSEDPEGLSVVFFESEGNAGTGPDGSVLLDRLRTVARKAQALLEAVPDLILLLDRDLSVADFSPPPEPWKERKPNRSWRGRPLEDVWPVLGSLLARSQSKILDDGKTIQAELEARHGEIHDYAVTASDAGDGQILVVVRNQSDLSRLRQETDRQRAALEHIEEAVLFFDRSGTITDVNPSAERILGESRAKLAAVSLLDRTGFSSTAELLQASRWPVRDDEGRLTLVESTVFEVGSNLGYGAVLELPRAVSLIREKEADPFVAEQAEHLFRNQLQLATSLHQFEPATSESREASLRWQVRLRVLMTARLDSRSRTLSVSKLLHEISNEIASLSGRGPASRCVAIEGSESLLVSPETVTSLGLFVGEVLRIVLIDSPRGSGPDLHFRFLRDSRGFLQLQFQSGRERRNLSDARAWEGEILEILAAQMQGSLTGRPVDDGEEWTLCAPVLAPGQ